MYSCFLFYIPPQPRPHEDSLSVLKASEANLRLLHDKVYSLFNGTTCSEINKKKLVIKCSQYGNKT